MTNEEIKQAAWKAWEEDMKTNPTQVNPYSFVYGYTVAAKRMFTKPDMIDFAEWVVDSWDVDQASEATLIQWINEREQ